MNSCQNNPEKLSTEKTTAYTIWLLIVYKDKDWTEIYGGKDCTERFYKNLKEHTTKKINYEKKEMISLIKKISLVKSRKFVTYAKKNLVMIMIIKSIIK